MSNLYPSSSSKRNCTHPSNTVTTCSPQSSCNNNDEKEEEGCTDSLSILTTTTTTTTPTLYALNPNNSLPLTHPSCHLLPASSSSSDHSLSSSSSLSTSPSMASTTTSLKTCNDDVSSLSPLPNNLMMERTNYHHTGDASSSISPCCSNAAISTTPKSLKHPKYKPTNLFIPSVLQLSPSTATRQTCSFLNHGSMTSLNQNKIPTTSPRGSRSAECYDTTSKLETHNNNISQCSSLTPSPGDHPSSAELFHTNNNKNKATDEKSSCDDNNTNVSTANAFQSEAELYKSLGFELVKLNIGRGVTSQVNLVKKLNSTQHSRQCSSDGDEPKVVPRFAEEEFTLRRRDATPDDDEQDSMESSQHNIASSCTNVTTRSFDSLSNSPDEEHEALDDSIFFAEKVINLHFVNESTFDGSNNHSFNDIEREEQCLMQCKNSPHIVQLNKSIRTNKHQHRFFLEYIDGTTLSNIIKQKKESLNNDECMSSIVTEKELSLIAQQLLRALIYLKQQGILHRDIKSENVMITRTGCVKLVDLGLAMPLETNQLLVTMTEHGVSSKEVLDHVGDVFGYYSSSLCDNEALSLTSEVITKGTYCYMCPHKLLTGNESFSSDLYSYGMTLLELFVGKLPFDFVNSPSDFVRQNNHDDAFSSPSSTALSHDTLFPLADIVAFDVKEYCTDLVLKGLMGEELCDFLCACMDKNIHSRSDCHSLQNHPFLANTCSMSHEEVCHSLRSVLNQHWSFH